MRKPVIDLDHNATTPVRAAVLDAMLEVAGDPALANPSSSHHAGRAARSRLEAAREQVAAAIGAAPGGLLFTSGGTEANHLAIASVVAALQEGGEDCPHAVVSRIEHPSTLAAYRELERRGQLQVTWIDARADGRTDARAFISGLTSRTRLASLLHVNNETGVIQDVSQVATACRERGIPLHCDAVQSLGKRPVDVEELGVDLLTISAHKVHGPPGVGALWVRDRCPFRHPLGGGPQERGRRPGTENLAGAVGFAAAVELLDPPDAFLRDRLWEGLRGGCRGVRVNGDLRHAVANTLNVSFDGVSAELLLIRLDLEGICASSGSACASGAREPSHVLQAMGLSAERISGAVRFSLGRGNTADDVDRTCETVCRLVTELRGEGVLDRAVR